MTTLTDPYAAKYRRRFGVLIFAVLLLLVGLIVRSVADGAPLLSVAPQPFWSTLTIFQAQPKLSLVLLASGSVAAANTDADTGAGQLDLSAFTGFSEESAGNIRSVLSLPCRPGVGKALPATARSAAACAVPPHHENRPG